MHLNHSKRHRRVNTRKSPTMGHVGLSFCDGSVLAAYPTIGHEVSFRLLYCEEFNNRGRGVQQRPWNVLHFNDYRNRDRSSYFFNSKLGSRSQLRSEIPVILFGTLVFLKKRIQLMIVCITRNQIPVEKVIQGGA